MRITSCLPLILILSLMATGCDTVNTPSTPDLELDTAPPEVPTGLDAIAGSAVVKLMWNTNTTDLDFAGYNVYRQIQGQSVLLNDEPLLVNQYFDTNPLRSSCKYGVTAVDGSGNESAWAIITYVAEGDGPNRRRD